jgi:enediyne core biosynthesis thioesterase
MPPYYEDRHVVEYDEINHVGNVYHANFMRWAGRRLEMFRLEHASSAPDGLRGRLTLVTVEAGCVRLAGIHAFEVPEPLRLALKGCAVVINHLSIEETA